jgi:dolichol-phosphate mannosyltransferase
MQETKLKLSIICPAYEEEQALPAFHQELLRVVQDLEGEFEVEIIYVDDGSQDGTLALLRRWARQDGRVRYLSLSRNFGHQSALTAGLEYAQGDLVITMDSDLQHPPPLIPKLIDCWRQGYEVVLTIRQEDPTLGWFKRTSSRWFYRAMGWLSETETRPAAADFRLMTRKAVNALLRLRESHRFLRGMVQWVGFPTTEVHYQPSRRVAGSSKYGLRRLFRFAGDALFSFSRVPLRFIAVLGALMTLAGLALTVDALVQALVPSVRGSSLGTLTILSAVGLVGGTVLSSLGIVGEYVGRIYEQVKDRPLYLLKETDQDREPPRLALPPSKPSGPPEVAA